MNQMLRCPKCGGATLPERDDVCRTVDWTCVNCGRVAASAQMPRPALGGTNGQRVLREVPRAAGHQAPARRDDEERQTGNRGRVPGVRHQSVPYWEGVNL